MFFITTLVSIIVRIIVLYVRTFLYISVYAVYSNEENWMYCFGDSTSDKGIRR